ncbi:hypothetical protein ACWDFL_33620 [Streptomyces bungoensis]
MKWPEDLSPWVAVARVDLPRQDIGGDDNLAAADATSITPWRSRDAHRPIGEILRVRQEVYRCSSIERPHQWTGSARTGCSAKLMG